MKINLISSTKLYMLKEYALIALAVVAVLVISAIIDNEHNSESTVKADRRIEHGCR